jgi:hypothetical protein
MRFLDSHDDCLMNVTGNVVEPSLRQTIFVAVIALFVDYRVPVVDIFQIMTRTSLIENREE